MTRTAPPASSAPAGSAAAALRVLLVGLSRQVGVAMEHIVHAVHPTAAVVKHDREATFSMGMLETLARSSDLCIVDVLGLGWTSWTEQRAQDLEQIVASRRAVLLLPPGDGGGWLQALETAPSAVQCLRLQHPASLASMRMALDRLRKMPPLAAQPQSVMPQAAQPQAIQPQPAPPQPVPQPSVPQASAPQQPQDTRTPTPEPAQAHDRSPAPARAHADHEDDPHTPVETTSGFIELPLELPVRPSAHAPLLPATEDAPPSAHGAWRAEPEAPISGFVDLPLDSIDPPASAPSPLPASTEADPPVSGFVDLPLLAPEPATAAAAPSASPADDEADEPPAHGHAGASGSAAAPQPARRQRSWPSTPFVLQESAYHAVCEACPALPASPLLDRLLRMAMHPEPQEFRVGRHAAVVVHPTENWVSSNMSVALRKRLTAHKLMLQIAEVIALAPEHALDAARALYGRREDGRRPLDGHFWSLVWRTFEEAPPAVDGALRLRLLRFPDVTRLPPMPDACLQMAILCRLRSHSVDELRQAFASHDPALVGLFALCATLSGMAEVVLPAPADSPAAPEPAPAPAPPPATRRPLLKGGFIRALLAKLF